MYEQILEALRRGANEDALQAAREAVDDFPDDPRSHRVLASVLTVAGQREAALLSMDQALALVPDSADLHFQRAMLLLGDDEVAGPYVASGSGDPMDPGLLRRCIQQAQLALARGDVDEAERLRKLAAHLDVGHPTVVMIAGMQALQRGDAATALQLLHDAAARVPEDSRILFALGFTYLAHDNLELAERAFRRIIDIDARARGMRSLLAELLARQHRYDEALKILAPLLDDPEAGTAPVQRLAGELQLAGGDVDVAIQLLKRALDMVPGDRRSLHALLEAWRRKGDQDAAREGLDALIDVHPEGVDLWRARLGLEPVGGPAAARVVDRWLQAVPGSIPALELKMRILDMQGEPEQAEAVARAIVDLQPEHVHGELRLVEGMIERDPRAAFQYLQQLREDAQDDQRTRVLDMWTAHAKDRLGEYAQAAQEWLQLQQQIAARLLPPPALTRAINGLPSKRRSTSQAAVAFLLGAPGSLVEQLAVVLGGSLPAFRSDRLQSPPPDDPFQSYHTAARLQDRTLSGRQVIDAWYAALPRRGIHDRQVLDWLPWWDNAFLIALRPHLSGATLLIALRDPRDMYLDWLARGAPVPFRIEDHVSAAAWLRAQLEHMADLIDQQLFPHHILRMDQLATDSKALTRELSRALGVSLREPPAVAVSTPVFAAGHWRNYRQPLAEPFAMLTPVAERLGYPVE